MPKPNPKEKIPQQSVEQNLVQRFGEERFAGQNRLKKRILNIETDNEMYRSELFDLNETVTKVLEKGKIKKGSVPMLQNQLGVVTQELANIEKMIQIYKKQLAAIEKKQPSTQQLQTIAESNLELKNKQIQLEAARKEVKVLLTKNRGMEYRLNEYLRKGKQKSVDSYGMMMKEAVEQNKVLKRKLDSIENNQRRKEEWMRNNYETTKDLQRRVSVLPVIQSPRLDNTQEATRSTTSLPKLEADKRIYQRWFKNYLPKNLEKIERETEDFQKIAKLLSLKITTLGEELQEMRDSLSNYKQRVTTTELEKARAVLKKQEEFKRKLKVSECNCDLRHRQSRRDWVGRFDGLRFSDARHVREETRLFRVVHNNVGYYQFSYYSVKNPQKTFACPLPFSTNAALKGKQSSFTVEYPDYIKTFKLRINPRTSKIFGMELISNLGVTSEFVDALQPPRGSKQNKQDDPNSEVVYSMRVKPNEAPTLMFGSYGTIYDDKKNLIGVHLQGLGMQMIENYVQEVM